MMSMELNVRSSITVEGDGTLPALKTGQPAAAEVVHAGSAVVRIARFVVHVNLAVRRNG